jgi:hypothetical protein
MNSLEAGIIGSDDARAEDASYALTAIFLGGAPMTPVQIEAAKNSWSKVTPIADQASVHLGPIPPGFVQTRHGGTKKVADDYQT